MSEKENLRQELLDLNKKRDEIEKQILSYQSVLKSVSVLDCKLISVLVSVPELLGRRL